MRFLKRWTGEADSASEADESAMDIVRPRVENGIVYDERGEALVPDTPAGHSPAESHALPGPPAVAPTALTHDTFVPSLGMDTAHGTDSRMDVPDSPRSLSGDAAPEDFSPEAATGAPVDTDTDTNTDADAHVSDFDIPDLAAHASRAPQVEADMGLSTDARPEQLAGRLHVELPADTPTRTVPAPQSVSERETPRAKRQRAGEPPALLHKRVNLGELRMDVARITSDIQSGERLYQRAQQRVESLMGFVERAEIDFSLLNRLEPENRRLKARNRVLEAENDAAAHEQRRLAQELTQAREDAAEATANLDSARTRLGAATTRLAEKDREIDQLTSQVEKVGLQMERANTSVEVESRENVHLRDQIADLAQRLDEVTSERMELAKIVESLKIDCDDFRAQRVNSEMKSQMVGLHEEIKGFKTQYEFNVISRDDRIVGLEHRIADLTKQLSIKDDVAKSALSDAAQLRRARSAQDLERERLERVIENMQRQLDDAQAQIQRSSDSLSDLDERYNDVAAALSVYQKRLSPEPAYAPDIDGHEVGRDIPPAASAQPETLAPPLSAPPLSAPPPFARDPGLSTELPPHHGGELTPENVEDMIMDYKLGLRSKLG